MIGERVRQLRRKKRMSLSELARRSGLSKSMISQIEHNSANPSVETVRSIAFALEVPVFTLFLENGTTRSDLVRKEERAQLTVPGSEIVRELLTPDLQRKMALVVGRMPPGAFSSPSPVTHRGEECVFVLRGQVNVQLENQLHSLNSGDTLYFDAQIPHLISNPGEEEAEFLSVITPPSIRANEAS